MENLNQVILGLVTYCLSINALSQQNCTMHRGMRKPRELKIRRYAACKIVINEYLAASLYFRQMIKLVRHN